MMLKTLKYNFLIQQNKNKVYNYACLLLKNKMDADDVAQEVFIRTWEHLDEVNYNSAKAWMMKTTHNLCIDYLRKRKLISANKIIFDPENEDQLLYKNDLGIDERVHLDSMMITIKNEIQNLPEQLKSIFILHELDGFKLKEISEMLDIPLNSVKVYLFRARKKLQENLRAYANE